MITINNRDPRPIYEQIMDNFKRLIASGVLAPDEKLPSVRELAGQLAINPNTIQRAYRELELEGYAYSVPGKGSFVGAAEEIREARQRELLQTLRETAAELRGLGFDGEALLRAVCEGGEEK